MVSVALYLADILCLVLFKLHETVCGRFLVVLVPIFLVKALLIVEKVTVFPILGCEVNFVHTMI